MDVLTRLTWLVSVVSGPSPMKGDRLKLTQPHTPHLMTKQRSRPPTVKSSADLESEEVDKLQKYGAFNLTAFLKHC